jgi:hypothetical protein
MYLARCWSVGLDMAVLLEGWIWNRFEGQVLLDEDMLSWRVYATGYVSKVIIEYRCPILLDLVAVVQARMCKTVIEKQNMHSVLLALQTAVLMVGLDALCPSWGLAVSFCLLALSSG